ncbi:MAG: DUF302 domain-containing protein [Hydrogenothermaceae bacterium]|nr:DUF302 domain-containing protein [Hydrogenothermaceae bacterium]
MKRVFWFTLAGSLLFISCGGTIKDISLQTGDYLGTGYDEPKREKVQLKEEAKEKRSIIKSLSVAVAEPAEDEEMPDIYEKSVNMFPEEVDILLRTELENSNFKIIYVSHISKGAQELGVENFWKNMNLYLVCKLSECSKVLKNNPQLVSQFPIRVYTYEKDGRVVIGTFRPSKAIKYMDNPDAEAIRSLRNLDRDIKKVLDSISK